ncbi:MAG: cytochrome C [Rhodocyclales bacterium]|nr:cytochrome C [Rhodocyclales bacterium]
MKKTLLHALAVAMFLPSSAPAHQPDIPQDAPASYKAECGSCHLAFLPALLCDSDWRDVMAQLDKHYGDNAGLDDRTRQEIEDFLVRNAGARWRMLFGSGDPPRLTATVWFNHEHGKLAEAVWSDKRVGSAANCGACHPGAERGLFSGRDLTMPPGYERRRNGAD